MVKFCIADVAELQMILYGLSGSGVSSTGNAITGNVEFGVDRSFNSITKECKRFKGVRFGRKIEVIDTPGFSNDSERVQINKIISGFKNGLEMMSSGANVVLLVVSINRFTESDKLMVRCLKKVPEIQKYTIVIFTGCEKFAESENEFRQKIVSSESLKELMELSCYRYILLGNPTSDDNPIEELFRIAEKLIIENRNAVLDKRIVGVAVEARVAAAVYNAEQFWILFFFWIIGAEMFYTRPKRAYERYCTIL